MSGTDVMVRRYDDGATYGIFGMRAKTRCQEQCLDCMWHIRVKGFVLGGLHRCRYENVRYGQPWLTVCAETIRSHGGMCLWHEKEANDD